MNFIYAGVCFGTSFLKKALYFLEASFQNAGLAVPIYREALSKAETKSRIR